MPSWAGQLCTSPAFSHINHTEAQSPWCTGALKLPMRMTEDDLLVEATSMADVLMGGGLTFGSLIEMLDGQGNCGEWGESELRMVFEAAFRLVEHRGQQWLDEGEDRNIQDFILMALDTATIWVRG